MNDLDLATAINSYMVDHPHATRTELRKKFNTSLQRLEKLHKAGLIDKVPLPLSLSAAATMGRKRNKLMNNWYISKPAPWQGGAA